MQPPQGYDSQNVYPGGQDGGNMPNWTPPQENGQWVQRPIPGQMQGGFSPPPGQVPPPAQIMPDPNQPYGYGGGWTPPENGAPPPEETSSAPAGGQGPKPGYQAPKTGLPRPRQQQGKAGYIVLTLIVLAFAVYAVVRMLPGGGESFGYVRYGAMSSRFTGDAVVVRNETVVSQESVSQIDFDVEEGQDVERGDKVATIYTSGFNAKEWVTLNNYRKQIRDYHKLLITGAVTDQNLLSRMDEVQTRAMEVQRLVHGTRGSISAQEKLLKDALLSMQIYIKQKNPDDQKLSRLYDDEHNQEQRIKTWTKQFAAASDGMVSFYTDGYEKKLNMTTFADFSPAQVRDMYNGKAPADEAAAGMRNATDIYRMVRKEQWAVLMLCNEKDWIPTEGSTYHLVIESFDNDVLTATVYNSTRSGGELLVRLLVDNTEFLEKAMYLRSCKVWLGEDVSTLMVPSRAIFVQDGSKGVVISTEGGEYWTGVTVISDDGSTAYVVPNNAGVLHEDMKVRLF